MIIEEAIKLGACEKAGKAKTDRQLAKLFFSPQGREFCLEHNYPSLEWFRSHNFEKYNVYVDKNVIVKDKDVALINSHGNLEYTEGYHKVILMHGATADIRKNKYACVTVEGEGVKWLEN